MAKNGETTTKFKADISELKYKLTEASRLVRVANSEFKAASDGTKAWESSADGLTAKLKSLNGVHDAEEEKLKLLKKQYELVAEQYGKNSTEAQNLEIKINNQQGTVKRAEAAIRDYTERLQKLDSAQEEAEDSSDTLDNSIEEVSDTAKKSSDGFSVMDGAIAVTAGNILTSFVSAIGSAISSLANLSTDTREFRQDMATLETAFDSAGFSTAEATETWKELYGIFGEDDRAVEAANNIARMAKSQEDLQEWTKITAGVWGTYQDALPVESLAEAAGETAKVGTVTGALADALNWSTEAVGLFANYMGGDVLTAEDAFNCALADCATEQERQALITGTLNTLYGDAADKYNETASSVTAANKATADQTLLLADLGEKAEPVTTAVTEGFNKILEKILELAGSANIEALTDKIETAFDTLIDKVFPAIADGLGWVIDNKDFVIAGIGGIVTALMTMNVADMIFNLVRGFQKFKVAQEGATVAQYLLNVAMSLNPIGIIVAAIAGLVAAFVILWNKCDWFREFWINLWEKIKDAFSVAVEWMKGIFDKVVAFFTTTIPEIFNNVVDFFKENWQALLLLLVNPFAGAFKLLYDNCDGFKEFVDGFVQSIKDFFVNMWGSITSFFTEKIPEFVQNVITFLQELPYNVGFLIGQIIAKFLEWWENLKEFATVKIPEFISNIVTALVEFVTVKIPEFIAVAINFIKELPAKIWEWLSATIAKVLEFGLSIVQSAKEKASEFVTSIINFIKELPAKIWEWLSATIAKVLEFGSDMAAKGKTAASDFFTNLVNGLSELPGKMLDIGSNIVQGIWNGISGSIDWLWDKISGFATSLIDGIKDGLGIHSPSRIMRDEVGKNIVLGVAKGIDVETDSAEDAMKTLSEKLREKAKVALSGVSSNFGIPEMSLKNDISAVNVPSSDTGSPIVYNFTQNNTSPKSLSRLEIYRQTRNQLNFAKGV